MELHLYFIAIFGGLVAGCINTLAGNGSAITLTILTEVLGLPGNVANGTNRLGVMAQSSAATFAFYNNGKIDWERSKLYVILTTIGAIAGVLVAIWVSNEQFLKVFRYLMVVMLFVILVKPKRWLRKVTVTSKPNLWIAIPAFLLLGFYGGFIQMGMGILFLATMVLGAKWSIMDSNVIKSMIVAIYTIVVIAIFQWKGLIDWEIGGIIAIGQMTGGWLTANFASKNEQANVWAHRLLVIMVVVAVLRLFGVF
ncbi:MAG: putative membrane protein YfcA [Paraglaciecola sp.]|jgi:uncharacterized membrane protein YfcA